MGAPDGGPTTGARYSVLGVWVHAVNPESTVAEVEDWIASGRRGYVCHATVHGVMEALHDPSLRRVYNEAGLTVPDGMPLVWLGRLRAHGSVRRVYGPDFMLTVCERAAAKGGSCFFYGGAPGLPEALAAELCTRFPGLRVVGAYSPPFRELTPEEDDDVIQRINAARPDIVWVGLGCPKQERWMAAHRDRLLVPALIGVGAAFDFHTGRLPQAPRWMQTAGLEWLFRLGQEPRRLWYRYLVYNSLFVLHLALQLSRLRRYAPARPEDTAPPAS